MMKIYNFYIITILCLLLSLYTNGQNTFKEKSDPEATKILKNLKKTFSTYDAIEIEYLLEIENGEDKELQKGKILQQGDKYRITNNGNIIINDTKTVWMYIKKQNEVQVNDYDSEDDSGFTPAQIFNIDENDNEFFYAITGEDSHGYSIEFKPLDSEYDFKKLRIKVNKNQTNISSIKIFQDDGSRMTFIVKNINNAKPSKTSFRFNKENYPGVKEVDLRD